MSQRILLNQATPEAWLTLLQNHAAALALEWLDLIVDQAELSPAWQNRITTLNKPVALLQDTPHEEAAEAGPVLLRVPLHATDPQLLKLLQQWHGQPRVMALLSSWDFADLVNNCRLCLQASWERGLKKGVLRYHDPRLFAAVVDTLDDDNRSLLLRPTREWHWLDRDGNARMQDTGKWQSPPPAIWLDEILPLQDSQVDALANWHVAEQWRQNHLLSPEEFQLQSEEELMTRLAHAHQAADKAKLWSEDARMPFVENMLHNASV